MDSNACLKSQIYNQLYLRYVELAKGTSVEPRVVSMMQTIVENCLNWPADKLGRWSGYVQCLLIEVVCVTSIEKEREFTRPLFQKLYKGLGHDIPPSVTVISNKSN